jgi:hypothetical protein
MEEREILKNFSIEEKEFILEYEKSNNCEFKGCMESDSEFMFEKQNGEFDFVSIYSCLNSKCEEYGILVSNKTIESHSWGYNCPNCLESYNQFQSEEDGDDFDNISDEELDRYDI